MLGVVERGAGVAGVEVRELLAPDGVGAVLGVPEAPGVLELRGIGLLGVPAEAPVGLGVGEADGLVAHRRAISRSCSMVIRAASTLATSMPAVTSAW